MSRTHLAENQLKHRIIISNFEEMDKITVTPAGTNYLAQHFPNSLPPLTTHPQPAELHSTLIRHSSTSKLGVTALRRLLSDDQVGEVSRRRHQTQQRAYLQVKGQLMKEVSSSRSFLGAKAEVMARRMLCQRNVGQDLQTEIGKGRNYLSKLQEQHQARSHQAAQIQHRLRLKARALLG